MYPTDRLIKFRLGRRLIWGNRTRFLSLSEHVLGQRGNVTHVISMCNVIISYWLGHCSDIDIKQGNMSFGTVHWGKLIPGFSVCVIYLQPFMNKLKQFAVEATAITLALNHYRYMGPVHHDVIVYSDSMSCLRTIESEDTENNFIYHIMNFFWFLSDKGTLDLSTGYRAIVAEREMKESTG